MKKMVAVLICAGVSLWFADSVRAEDAVAPKGHEKARHKMERFEKADANKDGKLSLDEFKTMCTKPNAEEMFKAADADKDGFVTPAELKAAHQQKKAGEKCDKAGVKCDKAEAKPEETK